MLYIKSFSNYTEFQEIFGVRVFGEEKARKNKRLNHIYMVVTIQTQFMSVII